MDKNEINWVAGILEGEGSFAVQEKNNRLYISCSMTDEDVIKRLHSLVKVGVFYIEKLRENRKQVFTWRVGNRREVVELSTLLFPYMGVRRQARIKQLLEHNEKHPKLRQEKGKVTHGTRAMYSNYGCRCEKCREAERAYKRPDAPRQYRRNKNVQKTIK